MRKKGFVHIVRPTPSAGCPQERQQTRQGWPRQPHPLILASGLWPITRSIHGQGKRAVISANYKSLIQCCAWWLNSSRKAISQRQKRWLCSLSDRSGTGEKFTLQVISLFICKLIPLFTGKNLTRIFSCRFSDHGAERIEAPHIGIFRGQTNLIEQYPKKAARHLRINFTGQGFGCNSADDGHFFLAFSQSIHGSPTQSTTLWTAPWQGRGFPICK